MRWCTPLAAASLVLLIPTCVAPSVVSMPRVVSCRAWARCCSIVSLESGVVSSAVASVCSRMAASLKRECMCLARLVGDAPSQLSRSLSVSLSCLSLAVETSFCLSLLTRSL